MEILPIITSAIYTKWIADSPYRLVNEKKPGANPGFDGERLKNLSIAAFLFRLNSVGVSSARARADSGADQCAFFAADDAADDRA